MSLFIRSIVSTFLSATVLGRLAIATGLLALVALAPFVAWWLVVHLVTFVAWAITSLLTMVLKALAPLIVLGVIGYAITHD